MKRLLFKLALFLLFGAIVNVAVAWGCAKWIMLDPVEDTHSFGIDFRDGNDWRLSTTRSNGALLISSGWGDFEFLKGWPRLNFKTATSQINMHFKFIHTPVDKQLELTPPRRILTAYGWPSLALWSAYEFQGDVLISIFSPQSWTIKSGFRISGEQFTRRNIDTIPRTLPYRPIWPGFAINTIFYAVILWLLTLAPFSARRIIRRKRGLCIKCGYDLRNVEHEKCPECGNELSARAKL